MWYFIILALLGVHLSVINCKVPVDVKYINSCNSRSDSEWTKGSGFPIRSWLKSATEPTTYMGIGSMPLAAFQIPEYKDSLTNGNLSWYRFGFSSGAGWLYGKIDPSRDEPAFIGDIAFIYPDMETVILGSFNADMELVSGQETRIRAFRCQDGIMELKFKKIKPGKPVYHYEEGNDTCVTSTPTLMDPYDRRNIYLGQSTISNSGDRIFAKRRLPADMVIVTYAGLKVYDVKTLHHESMTIAEREDAHKNLMNFLDEYHLNIDQWMTDIANYRASLGHKVNHKFEEEANVEFNYFKNPRFGEVGCLVTKRDIQRGEEIFLDYYYDPTEPDVPRWYKRLYQLEFGEIQ